MNIKKYLWLFIIIIIGFVVIVVYKASAPEVAYVEFTTTRPVKGNLESSIVISEWSDFECPSCGSAFPVVESVFEQYSDKIKFEYRHFPLNIHRSAYEAAVASECAHDQGKFWEYQEKLFSNQQSLSNKDLQLYAEQIGLDTELFEDCIKSGVKKKVVDSDLKEANRLGLNFTPSIIVNGELLPNWSTLPGVIQLLIKPAAQATEQNEDSMESE